MSNICNTPCCFVPFALGAFLIPLHSFVSGMTGAAPCAAAELSCRTPVMLCAAFRSLWHAERANMVDWCRYGWRPGADCQDCYTI